MKKTLFLAAAAALFTFASCQKEETIIKDQKGDLVFTATISQSVKTTINASTGAVAWVEGDEITITDAASTAVKYTVSSIDAQGKATFTKKSGESGTLGAGPYTAVYGTAPTTAQTYSATASALPMSAESTTTDLTFTVSCGLLELNLTAGEKISSIEVKGTPTGGSQTTYVLTCEEPVSIASGAKFYIALPAGSYTSFLLKGENGAKCKKEKSGESIAIAGNQIQPVTLTNLHFAVQLWPDGPYWATTNIGATAPTDYGQYFAWGHTTGQALVGTEFSTAFNKDNYPHLNKASLDTEHDMATANWGSGWSVPDVDQLDTLFNYDHYSGKTYDFGMCTISFVTTGNTGVKITGKETGYTSNSIFLPMAGCGFETELSDAGEACFYWARVTYDKYGDGEMAYYGEVYLDLENIEDSTVAIYGGYKHCGGSVRPVRSSL